MPEHPRGQTNTTTAVPTGNGSANTRVCDGVWESRCRLRMGCPKNCQKQSGIQILSGNLVDGNGQRLLDNQGLPYVVKNVGGSESASLRCPEVTLFDLSHQPIYRRERSFWTRFLWPKKSSPASRKEQVAAVVSSSDIRTVIPILRWRKQCPESM